MIRTKLFSDLYLAKFLDIQILDIQISNSFCVLKVC